MNKLELKLFELYTENDINWKKIKQKNYLNDTGAKDIIINPSDAKSIAEVESFMVYHEVKGSRIIKCKRET